MLISAFDQENFNEADYPAVWFLTKKNDEEGHYQLACDNNIIYRKNTPGQTPDTVLKRSVDNSGMKNSYEND
jgi:hypothetical protein